MRRRLSSPASRREVLAVEHPPPARPRARELELRLGTIAPGPLNAITDVTGVRVLASRMGVRNYLIEGVSGTGKTSVCRVLQRRGYHAVNGDTELAYQGDPETGTPTAGQVHGHHIWNVDRVEALVADQHEPMTFFCGGSRNFSKFIDLFDGVFVLEVDRDTMLRRLEKRPDDEWGGKQSERDLAVRLHQTKEDLPTNGIVIDATAPLGHVVDEILSQATTMNSRKAGAR